MRPLFAYIGLIGLLAAVGIETILAASIISTSNLVMYAAGLIGTNALLHLLYFAHPLSDWTTAQFDRIVLSVTWPVSLPVLLMVSLDDAFKAVITSRA